MVFTSPPENWPWSSIRATAGPATLPEGLHVNLILSQFGENIDGAQTRYREFVGNGISEDNPWNALVGRVILFDVDRPLLRHHE